MCGYRIIPVKHIQFMVADVLAPLRRQDINNHDIDYVG